MYGGLGVSELRELKQLKEEYRKLKQLVADLSIEGFNGSLRRECLSNHRFIDLEDARDGLSRWR